MPSDVIVRIRSPRGFVDLPGTVDAVGPAASVRLRRAKVHARHSPARGRGERQRLCHLALGAGPRREPCGAPGARGQGGAHRVSRPLARAPAAGAIAVSTVEVVPDPGVASRRRRIDLNAGREGAAPLWLLPAGVFSASPTRGPDGPAARDALVTAARWISSRRTSTFARLFPPSAFHPEEPVRNERLSARQARGAARSGARGARCAAVGGERGEARPSAAATLRSAALTVLSHILATSLRRPRLRAGRRRAAARDLRAHRHGAAATTAPAGAPRARDPAPPAPRRRARAGPSGARAAALVAGLLRAAPPYAELTGPWNFAMCSRLASSTRASARCS